MKKPTPYQRIYRAGRSKIPRGVRLTADECLELSFDDAIATRAMLDDNPDLDGDLATKIEPKHSPVQIR